MAIQDLPIRNASYKPDNTGDVFIDEVKNQLALANADGGELCTVLPAAATISADSGVKGSFTVPQNYASGPILVIKGILDGAPGGLVIAFGVQMKPLADNEAYDQALGTQDLASTTDSRADEDEYVELITLTNAGTFVIGDEVPFFFYIDDSVHTYTGQFLLTGLFFRYTTT